MMMRPQISNGRAISLVAGAELKSFWGGASAGLAVAVFLGLSGFFFYNGVADYVMGALLAASKGRALDASISLFSQGLTYISLVMMLVAPLVTMRSLTPARRGGRLDFFQTMPLNGPQIILGQYLSAFLSLAILIILALVPFVVLLAAGVGSLAVLFTAAAGLLALGSALAALGLMCSAASSSPMGAALGALGLGGLMWVLGWAAPYLDGLFGDIWSGLAFMPRISRFALGMLDGNDLLFFAVLTVAALLNAAVLLAARTGGGD
ncbi:hypothetical protein C4J81_13220 [Deltaproteobacteria bacterium Smac51]|nr:hypothetical protein C4J81_13220 [Deltaproteobacteria bacterium Smac51]